METEVKFIGDEIKPDIDTMAVQIFTDLPGDNPFQLSTTPQGPVYQQLAMEDSHSDVTQALEGRFTVLLLTLLSLMLHSQNTVRLRGIILPLVSAPCTQEK